MSAEQRLPAAPTPAELDRLQGQPERWLGVARTVAARYSSAPVRAAGTSTVLVALVGSGLVVKLYAPFLHDHFAFERTMLAHLQGRLTLPTPRLVDSGEHQGWPLLVMSQLPGTTLDVAWPALTEAQKLAALRDIGRTAADVHRLPVGPIAALAPPWPQFLQEQRERCHHRQQRTGLPAHLLAGLADFLDGPLPAGCDGPDVILTGEYTPFNLMSAQGALSGMFDFGDGLVGPAPYDWLGPMCFLAAGHAARLDALFEGYAGRPFDRREREPLLRLLLLHRYSCLPAQIAWPGWQELPDFAALAAAIWP